tara:strand:+ start:4350 stop:4802 length:453 start_codon:yes stop_codon:yes gene_type:complete
MENWRQYKLESQLEEGFKEKVLPYILAGAAAFGGATSQASASEPSSGDISVSDELGLDKKNPDHDMIITDKIYENIIKFIKQDKVKLKLAANMEKDDFAELIIKLSTQAMNNLPRFSEDSDIEKAAKKVVNMSNDLKLGSIKSKLKRISK